MRWKQGKSKGSSELTTMAPDIISRKRSSQVLREDRQVKSLLLDRNTSLRSRGKEIKISNSSKNIFNNIRHDSHKHVVKTTPQSGRSTSAIIYEAAKVWEQNPLTCTSLTQEHTADSVRTEAVFHTMKSTATKSAIRQCGLKQSIVKSRSFESQNVSEATSEVAKMMEYNDKQSRIKVSYRTPSTSVASLFGDRRPPSASLPLSSSGIADGNLLSINHFQHPQDFINDDNSCDENDITSQNGVSRTQCGLIATRIPSENESKNQPTAVEHQTGSPLNKFKVKETEGFTESNSILRQSTPVKQSVRRPPSAASKQTSISHIDLSGSSRPLSASFQSQQLKISNSRSASGVTGVLESKRSIPRSASFSGGPAKAGSGIDWSELTSHLYNRPQSASFSCSLEATDVNPTGPRKTPLDALEITSRQWNRSQSASLSNSPVLSQETQKLTRPPSALLQNKHSEDTQTEVISSTNSSSLVNRLTYNTQLQQALGIDVGRQSPCCSRPPSAPVKGNSCVKNVINKYDNKSPQTQLNRTDIQSTICTNSLHRPPSTPPRTDSTDRIAVEGNSEQRDLELQNLDILLASRHQSRNSTEPILQLVTSFSSRPKSALLSQESLNTLTRTRSLSRPPSGSRIQTTSKLHRAASATLPSRCKSSVQTQLPADRKENSKLELGSTKRRPPSAPLRFTELRESIYRNSRPASAATEWNSQAVVTERRSSSTVSLRDCKQFSQINKRKAASVVIEFPITNSDKDTRLIDDLESTDIPFWVEEQQETDQESLPKQSNASILPLELLGFISGFLISYDLYGMTITCKKWKIAIFRFRGGNYPVGNETCPLCLRSTRLPSKVKCITCKEAVSEIIRVSELVKLVFAEQFILKLGQPDTIQSSSVVKSWHYWDLGITLNFRRSNQCYTPSAVLQSVVFYDGSDGQFMKYPHEIVSGIALSTPAFETFGQYVWNSHHATSSVGSAVTDGSFIFSFKYSHQPIDVKGLPHRLLTSVVLHINSIQLNSDEKQSPWCHVQSIQNQLITAGYVADHNAKQS